MSKRLFSLIMAGGVLIILPFGTLIDGQVVQFKQPGAVAFTSDLLGGLSETGSGILAQSYGINSSLITTTVTPNNNQTIFAMVQVASAKTITGVAFHITTQGVFTANLTNQIGLYSVNPTTGVLTLIASSNNNGALFQAAAPALVKEPFSAPLALAAGSYWIGFVYNRSAVVTDPVIGAATPTFGTIPATLDLPNSEKTFGLLGGTNALPATQAMSGIAATNIRPWLALY